MKDLLRDNIIVQSDIKAEKNYVEKYYMLNVDLFEKIKNKDLMNTIIPRNVTITDSTMAGKPAVNFRKDAPASRSYFELAKEIEKKLKVR